MKPLLAAYVRYCQLITGLPIDLVIIQILSLCITRYTVVSFEILNLRLLSRTEEVDRAAGGGRHVGRDEGREKEDGHGEEGVHLGALSLPSLSPANCHCHLAAALPATVRNQCGKFSLSLCDKKLLAM